MNDFSTNYRVCTLAGLILTLIIAASAGARAADTSVSTPPTNAPLRQVGPGLFEIGKVRLNKPENKVSFPAVLNQAEGAIEYLLVTSYGKTHESLLRTDAEPYHIHLAMLLLGAKGAGTNSFPEDAAQPLPGDPILIDLEWKSNSRSQHHRAEDLIFNLQTRSVMSRGDWVYNGSSVFQGTFLAQDNGSIVSVMTDPDALMNNPRPGWENDKIWQVRATEVPPLNSPLEVTITLKRARQR
jgi:hypothetical protein